MPNLARLMVLKLLLSAAGASRADILPPDLGPPYGSAAGLEFSLI